MKGKGRNWQEKELIYLRRAALMVVDMAAVIISAYLGLALRFDLQLSLIPDEYFESMSRFLPVYIAGTLVVFWFFKMYHSLWDYAGAREAVLIGLACLTAGILQAAGMVIMGYPVPRSYYLFSMILLMLMMWLIRFSYRFLRRLRRHLETDSPVSRVMVVGAGDAGSVLIREIEQSQYLNKIVKCVIDDDPAKIGKYIHKAKIVGGRSAIPECAKRYNIDEIIVAMPSVTRAETSEILHICKETGCKLRILPGIYQLVNGELNVSRLRNVEIEDLLGREPVRVNLDEIAAYVTGKVVMVTGGGGSIGSELCRQIAGHKPKQLVIVDIYENNAYAIQMELKETYPELNLAVLIASVRDTNRMADIFATYRPQIVYHAAAHKHVPLMEDSPNEAIKNNVFGTLKTVRAAEKWGVERFILISTDKAVNPTSIMGASKRLCEMIIQSYNRHSRTIYAAVRFGNVLGSNGSVVPLFRHQIEKGGPVTVTHPDITRYFMTIPEAVSLVLQAGAYGRGG